MRKSNQKGSRRSPHSFAGKPSLLTCGLLWMLLALLGCGDDPFAPATSSDGPDAPEEVSALVSRSPLRGGLGSPDAVFAARREATLNNDFGTLFDTNSPLLRDRLAAKTAWVASTTGVMEGMEAEVRAVFHRHGVDEPRMLRLPSKSEMTSPRASFQREEEQQVNVTAAIHDKRSFYVEMATLLDGADSHSVLHHRKNHHGPSSLAALSESPLANVHIEGDLAIGYQDVVIRELDMRVPSYYLRIDGSWYNHDPTDEEARELRQKAGAPASGFE